MNKQVLDSISTSNQPQMSDHPKPENNRHFLVLFFYFMAITFVAIFSGIYYWQYNKVASLNSKVSNLRSQLSLASKANAIAQQSASTFTYTPHTAGLSLTLPKSYAVLVAADGNAGGAPGVIFRVVPSSDSHIANDRGYYSEARIVANPVFRTLDQSVKNAEQETMDYVNCGPQNGTCDVSVFSVSDTKVAGLSAKLIKASGINVRLSYYNVYVVGLGQWEYLITINNITNTSAPADLVTAILNGISIRQAAL